MYGSVFGSTRLHSFSDWSSLAAMAPHVLLHPWSAQHEMDAEFVSAELAQALIMVKMCLKKLQDTTPQTDPWQQLKEHMRVAFVYKKCLLDRIAAGHKFQLQSEHMTSLQERFVHVCEQEETSLFTCRDDTLLDDVLSGAMKQTRL